MNDTRQSRPASSTTTPPITKRARRPSPRTNDEDKQRERKRALDRKAQRASREKTRSYIAHLENMVQILSEKNGNEATRELMLEVERLHTEIERLRKIIDGIRSVLGSGTDEFELGEALKSRKDSWTFGNPSSKNGQSQVPTFGATSSSPENQLIPTDPEQSWSGSTVEESELAEPCDLDLEILPTILENSPVKVPKIPETNVSILNWTSSWDNDTIIVNTSPPQALTSNFPSRFSLPNPLHTSMPTPLPPKYRPCKIWQKANSIYAQIFQFNRERAISSTKRVKSGSLFKVVKHGWGALSFQERANPILAILKEVDQQLYWDCDPVTRIATLYKSWWILKYFFNPDSQSLENMPAWQRPVDSQKTHQHPIPIDFFPWPAIRDRLVRHHNYYMATSEFSVRYRQHLKFRWPFSFDDTYRYDESTDTYTVSPLFDRCHKDMRCWSMERLFFQKFPEFIGSITAYEGNGGGVGVMEHREGVRERNPERGGFDVDAPSNIRKFGRKQEEECSHQPGATCADNFGFADADVMELFNEYPDVM